MKNHIKIRVYMLCLLLVCLLGQAVHASGESLEDEQLPMQLEQIFFTSEGIHTNALYKVFYLSDNEIWYNFLTDKGNGKLLCFDLKGNLIETLNINLKGEDPSILCVNHVGDRLIVGYQDDSTNRAEVIILDSQRKEIVRKNFGTEVYTIQMAASERGILYAGGMNSRDGMAVFFLSEIDASGEAVFEYEEPVAALEADQGYIRDSQIYSDGENHYAIIKNGVKDSLLMEERLACFNAAGEKLWERDIADSFYINDMAVSDGRIYIVGAEGERDEYGCLVDQKGTVLCYDQSGALLGHQNCTNVEQFCFAVPSKQGCYAISSIMEAQAYMLFANENSTMQKAVRLKLPDHVVYTSFSLTDTDQLVAVGKTTDALYIGILKK